MWPAVVDSPPNFAALVANSWRRNAKLVTELPAIGISGPGTTMRAAIVRATVVGRNFPRTLLNSDILAIGWCYYFCAGMQIYVSDIPSPHISRTAGPLSHLAGC